MACGIVIVDKPSGWTSQDVTAKLRGVFHEKRIGHGGTLDPMATGVLPVFVGRATRAVPYFESAEKTYVAGLRLGITTNTQDTEGEILTQTAVSVTEAELERVLCRFRGELQQIPPMYSAVKIGGKKLYELARRGEEIQRPARKITVFSLELLGMRNGDRLLKIHCSKGTYVRTLCHDIGAALGCGGAMSSLRRIRAGAYEERQAVALEELISSDCPERYLMPVDSLFSEYPEVIFDRKQTERCFHGAEIRMSLPRSGRYRVYDENGVFLMLGVYEAGVMRTEKSFFEVN